MLDDVMTPGLEQYSTGFSILPASESEALDLAKLAAIASENLCVSTWEDAVVGGETALEVGARRVARKQGTFSYRNAEIAMREGKVIGAVISHPIILEPIHDSLEDAPPYFRPFLELERVAGPSWNISFLATYEPYRQQGVASALVAEVERRATAAGHDRLCLIVGDANPARRLYRQLGFTTVKQAPVGEGRRTLPHRHWILKEKPLR